MLVLSRRENEKVLFPKLGISVEVVQTKGNTVRLGIEAPREIRVIRGELTDECDVEERATDPSFNRRDPVTSSSYSKNGSSQVEIRKQLDAANLAIHLAQNQLQQGLSDRAEAALDQALHCLRCLDNVLAMNERAADQDVTVRESVMGYETNRKPLAVVASNNGPTELIKSTLERRGYQVTMLDGRQAIEYLQQNEPAKAVLTDIELSGSAETLTSNDYRHPDQYVSVPEVRGLQPCLTKISIGKYHATGWFASEEDAKSVFDCFRMQSVG